MISVNRTLQGWLGRLAHLVYHWHRVIVIAAVAGTLVAAWIAYSRFQVINNIGAILDETSAANRLYREYKADFNVDEEYVFVIQGEDPALNREVADELARRLGNLGPGIGQVFGKRDFSEVRNRALLLQPAEELRQMRDEMGQLAQAVPEGQTVPLGFGPFLEAAVRGFQAQGEGAAEGQSEAALADADSWEAVKPQLEQLTGLVGGLAAALKGEPVSVPEEFAVPDPEAELRANEYNTFQEGRTLVLLATPGVRETASVSPYTETVASIRKLIDELNKQYPEVVIGLTGEPVLNDDEMQTANRDAMAAAIITLALIVVLFLVSYRDWTRPLIATGVLLMAVAWAFAFTMLFVGHLNIISQAFVPMMLGLGIDFGIQILGRYEEGLARGRDILGSLEEALRNTGAAVITGGMTTAVAFYTMCFNEFVGLAELGTICGTAIVFALLVNLVVLPAVFVWRDRGRDLAGLRLTAAASAYAFPDALDRNLLRAPRAVLIVGALVTAVAFAGFPRVSFDYNLLNLQNPKLESVRVEKALFKTLGSASIYASVMVENPEEARAMKAKLEALPSVREVVGITDFLPADADDRLALVQEIQGAAARIDTSSPPGASVDLARLSASLQGLRGVAAAAKQEAQPLAEVTDRAYQKMAATAREAIALFDRLDSAAAAAQAELAQLPPAEARERVAAAEATLFGPMQEALKFVQRQKTDRAISLQDLPPDLRERFIGKSGRLLLQVQAKGNIWEREPLVEFVGQVRSVAPEATGTPVQNYEYVDLLRASYLEASLVAFVAIAVMIFLHFRHLGWAALAMLPLMLAVVWTLGLMGWSGIMFNPANIMTLPMVIGIGVAYGVYTVDRYREDGRMDIFSTSTGKAIVLSATTTIFAFGSMLISAYRGLFSMGLVMAIGVAMCLLTSIGLLPQLLKLMSVERQARGLSGKPPGAGSSEKAANAEE